MSEVITCGHCKTEFVGPSNQIYCSKPCKRQAQQDRDLRAAIPEPPLRTTKARKDKRTSAPQVPVLPDAQPNQLELAIQSQDPSLLKMHLDDKEKERRHQRKLQKDKHKHERDLKSVESVRASSSQEPLASVPEASEKPIQAESPAEEEGVSLLGLTIVGVLGYGAYRLFSASAPKPQPKSTPKSTATAKPGLDGFKEWRTDKKAQESNLDFGTPVQPIKPASKSPQSGSPS